MAVFITEPNKAIISYMSNGKPLIIRFDCCLEIVGLLNLHCRLIITLTSSQGRRYFKLSKVCSEITIHCHEFLEYRRKRRKSKASVKVSLQICPELNANEIKESQSVLTVLTPLSAQGTYLIFGLSGWAVFRGGRLFEAGRLLNFHQFQ